VDTNVLSITSDLRVDLFAAARIVNQKSIYLSIYHKLRVWLTLSLLKRQHDVRP
jgi:hypothetical protein